MSDLGLDPATAPISADLDLDAITARLNDCDLGDGAAASAIAEELLAEVKRLRLAQTTLTVGLRESGRYCRQTGMDQTPCPKCPAVTEVQATWRDYSLEGFGSYDVMVVCRTDGGCEWHEETPEGRYFTLGEAVDAARVHVAYHAQMAAEDAAVDALGPATETEEVAT